MKNWTRGLISLWIIVILMLFMFLLVDNILGAELNVRAYGAVGDGKANDSLALQAVFAKAKKDDMIYFPGGTYLITNALYMTIPGSIRGDGISSIIYQAGNESLLVVNPNKIAGFQYLSIKEIALLSNSNTGACLQLNRTSDSTFENILFAGGQYGIHICGSLRNKFIALSVDRSGSRYKTNCMDWAIYSEPDKTTSLSSNSNNFLACSICGSWGISRGGYYFADTNSAGSFSILGGTTEGHTEHGIKTSGIISFIISGNHVEGGKAYVEVINSQQGQISGLYSDKAVKIVGSRNITIQNCYVKGVDIDKNSLFCNISHNLIGDLDIKDKGRFTTKYANIYARGGQLIPSGQFNISSLNLAQGGLEQWVDNAPMGFVVSNAIESQKCLAGKKSALATVAKSKAGIFFPMDKTNLICGALSASAWFYSDTAITVSIWYEAATPRGVSNHVTYKPIEAKKWTKADSSFICPESVASVTIWFGIYSGTPGSVVNIDDVVVVEGIAIPF